MRSFEVAVLLVLPDPRPDLATGRALSTVQSASSRVAISPVLESAPAQQVVGLVDEF
ncbi:hypothetical protein L0U85_09990 [Glycomyces sp. L485]|uniref:hypothetical protein n=1 Tax=Glycomyces sp. L485 TaxID=2909235 RepID=UPI001F4B1047|nr:hypothetical protein [Glycomyces sp. L485]MCH7231179.1 hypothetical protein [Glycomyces sp. L485]